MQTFTFTFNNQDVVVKTAVPAHVRCTVAAQLMNTLRFVMIYPNTSILQRLLKWTMLT